MANCAFTMALNLPDTPAPHQPKPGKDSLADIGPAVIGPPSFFLSLSTFYKQSTYPVILQKGHALICTLFLPAHSLSLFLLRNGVRPLGISMLRNQTEAVLLL